MRCEAEMDGPDLAPEGERFLAESMRVADVGEDDLLALLLELGGAEVELPAHRVLHLLDVLVQLLVVQRLPRHLAPLPSLLRRRRRSPSSCVEWRVDWTGWMSHGREWGRQVGTKTRKQGSR